VKYRVTLGGLGGRGPASTRGVASSTRGEIVAAAPQIALQETSGAWKLEVREWHQLSVLLGMYMQSSEEGNPAQRDRPKNETISILVVDDEFSLRESCASLLKAEGYGVTLCGRGDDALDLMRRKKFDILLVDLFMSQVPGMEILASSQEHSPDTIVIIMTGNPSVESSLEGLRAGAWDYLPKPFSATQLQVLIGRAAHAVHVARESQAPAAERPKAKKTQAAPGVRRILGESEAMRAVIELAQKVAKTDASVFITGESGTGKELLAHFIHEHSRRSSRSLVPVNCAALPEPLLESEMFGHTEGAFTGATKAKPGLLEVAHGGTLFLDELSDMPASVQAKILRVIQDGVVRRVGSTRVDAVVNIRFIAATNIDPLEAVRNGSLRRDLHYRLRVVPIHIPSLKERREDIPVLADSFLAEFWNNHRDAREETPRFSDAAMSTLQSWQWRGNVRELRNVVEHLVVLASPGSEIRPEEIPFIHEEMGDEPSGSGLALGRSVLEADYHTARDMVLAQFEKDYLDHVVRRANGNISDAARMAGVDRTTLYRMMERHGTSRDQLLSDLRQ
jgi:DNA-binding NtrC family response regulator